jgi:hypothetical protein
MRVTLGKSEGDRRKFAGTFVKMGKKISYHGYNEETVLLRDIVDIEENKIVAHHVWFAYTKTFQKLSLEQGVCVEFEARVKKYTKGFVNSRYKIDNRTMDYKLSHPTKICLRQG